MTDKSENIDNFFRNKLENFEETPDLVVWENISVQLERKKTRSLVFLVSKVAAGAALLVALGLGYYLLNRQSSQDYAESAEVKGEQEYDKTVISAVGPDDNESREVSKESYPDKLDVSAERVAEVPQKSQKAGKAAKDYKSKSEIPVKQAFVEDTEDIAFFAVSEEDDQKAEDNVYSAQMITINEIENPYHKDLQITSRYYPKPPEEISEGYDYEKQYSVVETDEESWKNQWAVGGQMAPLYSYRHFSSDYLSNYVQNQINSKESGIVAYAMGVNVAMAPAKRLSVQSGIYYSKYGQQTEVLNVTVTAPSRAVSWDNFEEDGTTTEIIFSNTTGTIDPTNSDREETFNSAYNGSKDGDLETIQDIGNITDINSNSTATQYFEYVEVPLIVKYKLIDRKVDFNISGGFSTNILIGNDIYVDEGEGEYKYGETVNITTMNYSSSLGMGIEYPVISNFVVSIEPKFRYYLNPIDKRPSYTIHPYSFGIFTGISYVF